MSTTTPNLGLSQPVMTDQINLTIPQLANDLSILDTKIGNPNNLTTTDKTSLVNAINENKSNISSATSGVSTNTASIGTLSSLTTTNKSNLVAAINEVNGEADANTTNISTNTTAIGTLASLNTTSKTNLVSAINEVIQYPVNSVLRQSIINGGFSVNQRVVSGTVTLAAGAYGHDRWKSGAAGCTYTFATVDNVTTITITAGSLVQVIEGINLSSGTYTLSWTGTSQGKIGAGSFSASGVTGTATGGTNLSIEFNTGTLSKVQFNSGGTALSFQPKSFAEELQMCQRYYEKSYAYADLPGTSIAGCETAISYTTDRIQGFSFKVRKRVSPTVIIYSRLGTINKVGLATTGADVGTSVTAVGFEKGVQAAIDSGAGFTVGTGYIYHWTGEAEL